MLDILRDYLVTATTPEHFDLIERAHNVFDKYGLNAYDSGFENILMTEDYVDTDTGETVTYIDYLTRKILKEILLNRTIVLIEPSQLSDLVDVAEAMWDIENYEVASDIVDICAMDGTAIEKLGEILSLVCTHAPENLMTVIESVDDSLIERFVEVFSKQDVQEEDEEIKDDPLVTASLTNFKAYLMFIGTQDLKCVELVKNNLPIALPFQTYTDIIGREFENMDNVTAAREFVGLAILSSDARENPKQYISSNIERYVSDLKTITNITIIVTDMLVRFEIFKTTEANRLLLEQINRGQ